MIRELRCMQVIQGAVIRHYLTRNSMLSLRGLRLTASIDPARESCQNNVATAKSVEVIWSTLPLCDLLLVLYDATAATLSR